MTRMLNKAELKMLEEDIEADLDKISEEEPSPLTVAMVKLCQQSEERILEKCFGGEKGELK